MRAALCNGELSWSMAVLCASKTIPEQEAAVLAKAKTSTVRQMRQFFGQASAASTMPDMQTEPSRWNSWDELDQLAMCDEEASYARKRGTGERDLCVDESQRCRAPTSSGIGDDGSFEDAGNGATELDEEAAATYDQITRRTVQRTVSEAVVYKFEATRILLQHLESEGASSDAIMEAMLAETQTQLDVNLELDVDLGEMQAELEAADELRRNWLRTKRVWTENAHAACEPRLPSPEPADAVLEARPIPDTLEEIDAEIVGLCETLAIRDLQMGELAEKIIRADGWRRLGFADLGQYARERVGVSTRTLQQKVRLARDVRRFPAVGEALVRKQINVEAALRISRVASEKTVGAWIARAARRTVKHLDEEIEAVRRLERLGAPQDMGPPSEETLEAAFEIERMVVSGRLLDNKGESGDSASDGADGGGAESEHEHEPGGTGGSADMVMGAGSETQMSDDRGDADHATELIEFMLEAVWETWGPQFRRKPAYHEIYTRDRYRCTNPVCYGRTLNPHHLKFRSKGGTDEAENVGSTCWECHIPGIHEGRIRVSPPASNMRWVIGRHGTLVVQGRDKISSRPGAAIRLRHRRTFGDRHAARSGTAFAPRFAAR